MCLCSYVILYDVYLFLALFLLCLQAYICPSSIIFFIFSSVPKSNVLASGSCFPAMRQLPAVGEKITRRVHGRCWIHQVAAGNEEFRKMTSLEP